MRRLAMVVIGGRGRSCKRFHRNAKKDFLGRGIGRWQLEEYSVGVHRYFTGAPRWFMRFQGFSRLFYRSYRGCSGQSFSDLSCSASQISNLRPFTQSIRIFGTPLKNFFVYHCMDVLHNCGKLSTKEILCPKSRKGFCSNSGVKVVVSGQVIQPYPLTRVNANPGTSWSSFHETT